MFIRYYFLKLNKERLPDTNSGYDSEEGGDIKDAIHIIIVNFTEMNKLWIRLGKN